MATKVLFARVSKQAHSYATHKAKQKKGDSVGAVVERLLMNDKRKLTRQKNSRRASA